MVHQQCGSSLWFRVTLRGGIDQSVSVICILDLDQISNPDTSEKLMGHFFLTFGGVGISLISFG